MKDGQLRIVRSERLHEWERDRMVSTQRHGALGLFHKSSHAHSDRMEGVFVGEFEITRVLVCASRVEIHAQLGPLVIGLAMQRLANLWRSIARPAQVGRICVKGDSHENWHAGLLHSSILIVQSTESTLRS